MQLCTAFFLPRVDFPDSGYVSTRLATDLKEAVNGQVNVHSICIAFLFIFFSDVFNKMVGKYWSRLDYFSEDLFRLGLVISLLFRKSSMISLSSVL